MSFHNWLSTDSPDEDQCLGCGVRTHQFGEGVISDHGPLPIACPGPGVMQPHIFEAFGEDLECAICGRCVDDNTTPDELNWECVS